MAVRAKEDEAPMSALNRGYAVTTAIAMAFFGIAAYLMLDPARLSVTNPDTGAILPPPSELTWFFFFLCGIVGMVTSFLFVWITQYYTEAKYRPVQEIAKSSETGPATNIISGFSVGLEAVALPGIVISAALLISYYLGELSGLRVFLPIPGSSAHIALGGGLYGTAIATMGMLATAAYILAMDTFGPIVDNAAGIAEMSGQSKEVRDKMDKLDAAGNTTKALTKGYAVGSAALAAFLLFSAYLEATGLVSVDLAKPEVFVGAFLGVTLVFLFSALAIRAVGRAAWSIIKDVREQFKEKPGIMAGTEKPDYGRTVDLATRGALKEMIFPGVLAVLSPVAVGILLRAESLAAFLMVGTIGGVLFALVLNTGGGAWDNAKKHIEATGKKGSALHKAAVVGDTVGDPFKDTAGPSLHILVKLLSTITLVLAPLFI
jgi:K(+)-stimulated pyrophosphate-energized sodium pump